MVIDEDAKRLAKIVLRDWDRTDDSGMNAYHYCRYCGERNIIDWDVCYKDRPEITHHPDCIVLVAKDVLTS